jgi:hypothetical protein
MSMIRVMNCYLPLNAISAVEIKATGAVVHLSPDTSDVLSRNQIEVPIDDTPALCDWLDAMIEPPLVLHRALIEENTEPIEPVDYTPPKKAPARKPRGKRASD